MGGSIEGLPKVLDQCIYVGVLCNIHELYSSLVGVDMTQVLELKEMCFFILYMHCQILGFIFLGLQDSTLSAGARQP